MNGRWVALACLALCAVGLAVFLVGRGGEPAAPTSPGSVVQPEPRGEAAAASAMLPKPAAPAPPTGGVVSAREAPLLRAGRSSTAPPPVPSAPPTVEVAPDAALQARFELIFGDFPEDQRPADVTWTCPEAPHTCEVEATLASPQQIASFMHALEDNPQAEDDEIPTIYLQEMFTTEEGDRRFRLELQLP